MRHHVFEGDFPTKLWIAVLAQYPKGEREKEGFAWRKEKFNLQQRMNEFSIQSRNIKE
jgi:hypothetical protein